MRNMYKIVVRKSVGKKPLGIPRQRWEDNIMKDLGNGVGRCGLDSHISGLGPVAVSCEPLINLQVP
jgi:hypothetical protein